MDSKEKLKLNAKYGIKRIEFDKCYEMALICGYASHNCCLGEQSEKCYICPYYCDTFGNSAFSLRR